MLVLYPDLPAQNPMRYLISTDPCSLCPELLDILFTYSDSSLMGIQACQTNVQVPISDCQLEL